MRRKSMAQAAIGRGGSPVSAQERVGDASACRLCRAIPYNVGRSRR
jgi:hypothetical protein